MAKKTNVEINGQKYYRVTRTVGHKADGTGIKKTFYGTGINEANQKADEYMNKLKNGYSVGFDKVTVLELMRTWLYNVKLVAVKPATFVTYESNYRLYISKSTLANLYVCDVKKYTFKHIIMNYLKIILQKKLKLSINSCIVFLNMQLMKDI